jgi:hypothetical protein
VKRKHIAYVLIAGAVLAASGCTSTREPGAPSTLIPASEFNLSPSHSISAEALVAAGVLYLIIDPLAPNWKVEVEAIGPNRYRVAMTMKKFITGGEGEITPVLRRTAEKLRRERGFSDFAVLERSEGIESHVLIAQRVAHAVIELY